MCFEKFPLCLEYVLFLIPSMIFDDLYELADMCQERRITNDLSTCPSIMYLCPLCLYVWMNLLMELMISV